MMSYYLIVHLKPLQSFRCIARKILSISSTDFWLGCLKWNKISVETISYELSSLADSKIEIEISQTHSISSTMIYKSYALIDFHVCLWLHSHPFHTNADSHTMQPLQYHRCAEVFAMCPCSLFRWHCPRLPVHPCSTYKGMRCFLLDLDVVSMMRRDMAVDTAVPWIVLDTFRIRDCKQSSQ